jgi:uncharacterized membrane protein YgdD (TMEM256/DUF423 family)
MHKGFLKTAFLFALTAVALGAFGAHALKKIVTESALQTFETGVKYQFYHAIAIAIAAILYKSFPNPKTILAARFFTIGILLFSGSLYALALMGPAYALIGIITPFGGLSFMIGWITLLLSVHFTKEPI